jgi:CheY-like chemotaxis protein
VDDVETNLHVATGLLSPYKLNIDTVISGFAAIGKVENGNTYDIIFMDHMMPQMDGVETTHKLRELGYTGAIVALTANAIAGNDEMFMRNGFDDFIPKPVNVRQLDSVLNKFIRDRHPEEAKKYASEAVAQPETPVIDPKVLQIFRGDAQKAIVTLRETIANGDISLFATTAHAMKSALANVGKRDASTQASRLESAGRREDTDFIASNTDDFIETLETLIKNLTLDEPADTHSADISEDTAYLAEQLRIVKAACEDYNDDAAYAALDRLKEMQWKKNTADALEQIRDMLFIYSDFDGAAQKTEMFF